MSDVPRRDALDPGTDVAIYVHWPYCARICPYCDFNVVRDRGRKEEQAVLISAILDDLAGQAARIGPRRLTSVFLGGGTPSLMAPGQVAAVLERIRTLFPASGPAEVTLEANPTDAEAAHFAALADAGVNRLSLGVQSLDEASLRFLGRNHSAVEARRAIDLAGKAFHRLSIDLIHALPGQSPAAWAAELREAVAMGFEHISPYQLTVEPTTAFGRAAARGDWTPVDEDVGAALYETTQDVLSAAGFDAYEVSNHARGVAARSAHNIHVWRGGDYVGVGPGAHGRLTLAGVRTATVSHRKIAAYVEGVRAGSPWCECDAMDGVSAAEERILLGLRTVEGAPMSAFEAAGAAGRIADLDEDGFLTVERERVIATAKGRPILDTLLKALLT